MKLAIIGSRKCGNVPVDEIISRIPDNTAVIISGGAAGIDGLAKEAAQIRGISYREIVPDYQKYGKRAPLVRNEAIVRQADFVLAFWDCSSRGTASVIALCIEHRVPFEIVTLSS